MLRRLTGPALVASVLLASPATAAVPGDANCDGIVDGRDVGALTQNIFGAEECDGADVNEDGVVSAADVPAMFRSADTPRPGPVVTFFGVATSAGTVTQPLSTSDDGLEIYWRPAGLGFKLIVEAAAGESASAVGRVVEPVSGRPDLQIETDRAIGDDSFDRCPGTVPPVVPPSFEPGSEIDAALRAFGCGFLVSTTRSTSCTLDQLANPNYVSPDTQTQFCLQIESLRQFPDGQTRLAVQLRDVDGNLGPLARIIVQVGAQPQTTPTRTRTPTVRFTSTASTTPTTPAATRTATSTPTVHATSPSSTRTPPTSSPQTATRTPTRTATVTATTPSSQSPAPSRTATRSPTRTPTTPARTSTPSASPTRTTPGAPATATRTATSPASPTRTATPTVKLAPTFTRMPSPTPQLTPTRTPSRTRTRTPSPTSTPQEGSGPAVTFFGIVNANDAVATPAGTTPQGVPIYERLLGSSLRLVVEGRPGASGRAVGTSVFAYDPGDPELRPDLQIQVNRPLGNGSTEVCDNTLPMIGGIPAVNPPSFDLTPAITAALSDLGCRFINGQGIPGPRSSAEACTAFSDARFGFVCSTPLPAACNGQSTIQFCSDFVVSAYAFPSGDTLVTVRLRDTNQNTGPPASLIVRVP